jgi:hypothetical protein
MAVWFCWESLRWLAQVRGATEESPIWPERRRLAPLPEEPTRKRPRLEVPEPAAVGEEPKPAGERLPVLVPEPVAAGGEEE